MNDKKNIGVFASFDEGYKSIGDITYPILKKYCDRWGYDCTLYTKRISDRFIVWEKIKILIDNLDKYDFCVWVDSDMLVTNFTKRIEDIIGTYKDKDLIISSDCHNLNSGFMIFKSTEWSKQFLDKVWNIDVNHSIFNAICNFWTDQGEQLAIIGKLRESQEDRDKTAVVSQRLFNSYLYTLYDRPDTTPGNWEVGDFILHLPGCSTEQRVNIFTEKLKEIIY